MSCKVCLCKIRSELDAKLRKYDLERKDPGINPSFDKIFRWFKSRVQHEGLEHIGRLALQTHYKNNHHIVNLRISHFDKAAQKGKPTVADAQLMTVTKIAKKEQKEIKEVIIPGLEISDDQWTIAQQLLDRAITNQPPIEKIRILQQFVLRRYWTLLGRMPMMTDELGQLMPTVLRDEKELLQLLRTLIADEDRMVARLVDSGKSTKITMTDLIKDAIEEFQKLPAEEKKKLEREAYEKAKPDMDSD